jgi:hypothetical protein
MYYSIINVVFINSIYIIIFNKMNKFLIVLVLIAIAAATGPDPKKWNVLNLKNPTSKKYVDQVNRAIVKALSLPKE